MNKIMRSILAVTTCLCQMLGTAANVVSNAATTAQKQSTKTFEMFKQPLMSWHSQLVQPWYSQRSRAQYVIASSLANVCPQGSLRVSSAADCRAAAAVLGYAYRNL